MQEVRLTLKKRAFPSEGRIRLNIAHLPALDVKDGDHVDLINEATHKTVTVAVIADTMVRQGQVRVSAEDLAKLGLPDDGEVLVMKTPPPQEKVRKAAAGAGAALSKAAGDVKSEAGKAAEGLKKETKKASESIRKTAKKTAGDVKKAVKKATGDDSL